MKYVDIGILNQYRLLIFSRDVRQRENVHDGKLWASSSSDEDGMCDAVVTNLDLPRPTFRARDLHNQPT